MYTKQTSGTKKEVLCKGAGMSAHVWMGLCLENKHIHCWNRLNVVSCPCMLGCFKVGLWMRLFTFILSTTGLFQNQAVHAVDFPFLNISVPECWDQDTMLGAGHIYKHKTEYYFVKLSIYYNIDFFSTFSTMIVGEFFLY